MGDHSYPAGIVFAPDGQPGVRVNPPSPPDVGTPASQEKGYEEVETDAGHMSLAALANLSTTAPQATRTKVLNVARSQLGYVEGPNNDTKYGVWYGWNHVAYCAIGVTWSFAQAGGLDQIDGVRGKQWAYCPYFVTDWKRNSQWIDWHQPAKPGDVVFFNWAGTHGLADHVGLVESIDTSGPSPVLVTLEFNTTSGIPGNQSDGGGVYRRRRSPLWVVGYGRPHYAPEGTPKPIRPPRLMPLTVDGVWGALTTKHLQVWLRVKTTGVTDLATRRRLQEALQIRADGVWGPQTHKALQHRLGVTADGVWGPVTVKALQRFLNRTV